MANPRRIRAVVSDINEYSNDVFKLTFDLDKKSPKFKSGQFLHLTLEEYDPSEGFWPESRVFSISDITEDRLRISIVYSVRGRYTEKMSNDLNIGSTVWLKLPFGSFNVEENMKDGKSAVIIAGGTGVSPFIPYLKTLNDSHDVSLFYGIRNSNLMIFESEFKKIIAKENFRMYTFLENIEDKSNLEDLYSTKYGRLSIPNILENVDNFKDAVFFISGPPKMIFSFKEELISHGVSSEDIVIDDWE